MIETALLNFLAYKNCFWLFSMTLETSILKRIFDVVKLKQLKVTLR